MVIDQSVFAEAAKRPLESARWAGCIDSVEGNTLARALAQLKYGCSAAAIGLAGGSTLEHMVMPFLLRGVNLLGIDAVMCPRSRRMEAWTPQQGFADRAARSDAGDCLALRRAALGT
jgi:acrylyl-CoA reductase (NADPH)